MYPHDLHLPGATLSIWNSVFLLAIVAAYFVFRSSVGAEPRLTLPTLRYVVVVYLSALAAQIFAYAFDANTSLTPPPDVSAAAWYLSPLAGPKTLYGVIVLMPVSVALATFGTGLSLRRTLDLWTPAMLVVLATARVGCLLQGCCFGARSDLLGVSFPVGSPVYYQQLGAGLIAAGSPALPVIPTQAIEAAFLAMLALWSLRRRGAADPFGLFVPVVAAYSVFRFVIEFVRADVERGFYGPLATSQWIALVVLAAAAIAAARVRVSAAVAVAPDVAHRLAR